MVDIGGKVFGTNIELSLLSSSFSEIVGQHSSDFVVSFIFQFEITSTKLYDSNTFRVDSDEFFNKLRWFFSFFGYLFSLGQKKL